MRSYIAAWLATIIALSASASLAQTTFSGPGASSAPVEISADLFEIVEADREAVFSGNVVVSQDGFRLTADRVVVRYGENGGTDLQSLSAPGRTRIEYGGQTATGDRADFDVASRVLRLTGNVEVRDSSGAVTGPELVIDFARGTSSFGSAGGGGRVTGVFTPGN